MSDRSIGDYANRNVVKNPLLSTAVTGLSIEDLTHNAVLLPAVRSQGANIGLDQQIGTQSRTPEHSNNAISNLPSGDANSNFTPIHFITDHNQNPLTAQQSVENIKTGEQLCFTQSKASVKTEDDFDVNEYFARLQGTRYVSAPVNSLLKEDQNANLEATEENLEEINLNEPDKLQQDDVQQSLTADIAQNFSQLPTVLPQVASAVFSSFSNMLSLKSREQTPDEPKDNSGYQEVQFQRPDDTPAMSEGFGVREVAPPPKEPPVGTGNYRITTKKKAYAQIPGLSYEDSVQRTYQPPPLSQSSDMPYFVPTSNFLPPSNLTQIGKPQEIPLQIDAAMPTVSTNINIGQTNPPHGSQTVTQTQKDSSYYIFNPVPSNDHFNQLYSQEIPNQTTAVDDAVNVSVERITRGNQPNFIVPKDESSNIPTPSQNIINSSQGIPPPMISMSQGSIIPPPPMFSNIPRRDSQSGVGKSILPPSVARRISSNHPIIQNQPAPVASFTDNIFVPSPVKSIQNISNIVDNNSSQRTISQELLQSISNTTQNTSAFAPINLSLSHQTLPTSNLPSISASVSIATSALSTSSSNVSAVLTNTALPPNFAPISSSAVITPTSMPLLSNTFQPQALSNDHPTFPPINATPPASSLLVQSNIPPPPKSLSRQTTPESIQANKIPKSTAIMPPSTLLIPPLSLPTAGTEQIPSLFTSTSAIETQTLETTNLPPPPTFFNPNTFPKQKDNTEIKDINISEQDVLQSNLTQYFDPNITQTELVKPLVEPPKLSGNLSYRMIKKRPQYYSGPIEGVGAISNNVKPLIPSVEANTFQGAMFTPNQEIQPISGTIPNVAFDINRTLDNVSTPFDLSKPIEQICSQPNYDTAFDLSRQTSEKFETITQESKGFGIIGSLKSKLSSLDINKIQNTVTTFFDPAYNDIKNEPSDRVNVPYLQQQQSPTSFQQNTQNQISTFELFAPHVEPNTYNQLYDPCFYQNTSYEQNQTFSQPHNQYDYYQNQGQNIHQTSDYYSSAPYKPQPAYNDTPINTNISESYTVTPTRFVQENANLSKNTTVTVVENLQISADASKDYLNTLTTGQETQKEVDPQNVIDVAKTTFLESQISTDSLLPKFNKLDQKVSNLYISENTLDPQTKSEEVQDSFSVSDIKKHDIKSFLSGPTDNAASFFDTSMITQTDSINERNLFAKLSSDNINSSSPKIETKDSLLITTQTDEIATDKVDTKNNNIPTIQTQSIPLFNVTQSLDDKDVIDVKKSIKNVSIDQGKDTVLDDQTSLSEESSEIHTSKEDTQENELNMCETCREVNVPEGKPDSLTAQLIDNITSRIQLSNPVEVPLTFNNTLADRTDFDSNQCAEISHITEETIETIQVQSATELLENDDQADNADARTYGWCADDTPLYPASKVILDHDYSFQPDPSAIGFFSKNSLFFDDIPNNASDEIKAEFKNSHEDSTTILPRQMSIPSAPPAEDFDDTKSDVTGGLDVQSIEQDAKKDFPIYEEFVIEPSETDDDKIEFREREKSSDDSVQELDTFTNRVERFKKMEESTSDIVDDVFERRSSQLFDLPITTGPAITVASYFDTGNYAAETHYRKSLTSPSNMISFSIGSINIPMRIPPGFEDEYKKKFGAASEALPSEEKKENAPSIPDTSTQIHLSPTLTFTNVSNISVESSSTIKSTEKVQSIAETVKLPDFTTAFGGKELISPKSTNISTTSDLSNFLDSRNESIEITPTIPANQEALMLKDPPEPEAPSSQAPSIQSLPDPMNFFSTNVDSSEPRDESGIDVGVNRLASYFASPTKTDHSKSFFELSQSQDHYRQNDESCQSISAFKFTENENASGDNKASNINEPESFFETGQREPHCMDSKNTQNIPTTNQYLANMALMRDLTAYHNSDFSNNEQIVRTINYFTIEYDNNKINDNLFNVNKKNINKVTDLSIDRIEKNNSGNSKIDNQLGETINVNDNNFESIVNCKYCCNTNAGILKCVDFENLTNFKVRRTMDSNNSEPRKEQDGDMEEKKDGINRRSVNLDNFSLNDEANEGVAIMSESRSSTEYTPVKHHWFYRVDCEGKSLWRGFSMADSRALEEAFLSPDLNENTLVPTDGGRYDVNINGRLRIAVYWTDKPTNVRRCSWFYKGTDGRYVPYTESVAEKLEEEYRHGMTTGEWHRRLMLPNNELVVMHGPAVMVHFLQTPSPDAFAPPAQSAQRPRVVRRGCDEYEVEDTEPSTIDHLLLLCHGVGSACDMRFRPVEEVVDDFRATSLQLLQSHYRNSYENGTVGRVEVLPISWHSTLHSGEAGVDRRLAQITLDSIPRLRNFTNDTVLDVLFYTSPIFCQTIINTVCKELNRIYSLFKKRNPNFKGGVSLGGHSLGSVILYDLLCHQKHVIPSSPKEPQVSTKRYVSGTAGTGQPTVSYPRLQFSPEALYALGSPIAIFECIRGVESLGPDFRLPTCKHFFNIFHPYDPIAYRIEPLINPQLKNAKPYLIPHHKGRKRMHLELKDTMARVGADLKQKLVESIKSTWTSMWRSQPPPNEQLEKVVEEEIGKEQFEAEMKEENPQFGDEPTSEMLGQLNAGRRIDYVLQEAPFEMINEYLFAMTSHVGYWESEDTMLMILREIYDSLGVQPDNTVPQQSLTVERTRAIRAQEDSTFAAISDHPSTSRGDT